MKDCRNKNCTNVNPQPITEFYIRAEGWPQSECKSCIKKRTKARWQSVDEEERKYHNDYNKWTNAQIKHAVFMAYGGYICACCGFDEDRIFLQIDHINNDGAEFRRKHMRWKSQQEELEYIRISGCLSMDFLRGIKSCAPTVITQNA